MKFSLLSFAACTLPAVLANSSLGANATSSARTGGQFPPPPVALTGPYTRAAASIVNFTNILTNVPLSVGLTIPSSGSSGVAYLWDVNVTVEMTHPNPSQVQLYLIGPSGRRVTLSTHALVSGQATNSTACFDDQALDLASQSNVFVGNFVPEGALSAFQGANANGPWSLRVTRAAGSPGGTIHSASIELHAFADTPPSRFGPSTFVSSPDRVIPDGNGLSIQDPVICGGMGVNTAEVRVQAFIEHAAPGDLEVILVGPAQVELSLKRGGGNADVFNGVTWFDTAVIGSNDQPTSTHAYAPNTVPTGLVPESALGRCIGLDPNNGWVLKIKDTQANGLTGRLVQWSIGVWTWDPPSGAGPCASGTSWHGCVPTLLVSGNPNTLTAVDIDGARTGLFIYGIDGLRTNAVPWGPLNSTLCLNPPTQRMTPMTNLAPPLTCNGVVSENWDAFLQTHPLALAAASQLGQQVWAQYWWRDPQSYPKHSQLTNYKFFLK